MDTRKTPPRITTKFNPLFKWTKDNESETLVLSVPGFQKDQLKVQMDSLGNLRVIGERPLTNDHWSSFHKDFRVPKGTSAADIRAKIEDGNLSIKFLKPHAKPQKKEQNAKAKDQSAKPNEPDGPTGKIMTAEKQGGVQGGMDESGARNKKADEEVGALSSAGRDPSVGKDETRRSGKGKEKEDENTRKRKAENEGGIGMKLVRRQRQLLVNVGVAFVVLVGLTFYVSYKLKKTMEKDNI